MNCFLALSKNFYMKFILTMPVSHVDNNKTGLLTTPPLHSSGIPLVGNLRTRLLALHVLEAVLPACESGVEDDQMAQVCIFF